MPRKSGLILTRRNRKCCHVCVLGPIQANFRACYGCVHGKLVQRVATFRYVSVFWRNQPPRPTQRLICDIAEVASKTRGLCHLAQDPFNQSNDVCDWLRNLGAPAMSFPVFFVWSADSRIGSLRKGQMPGYFAARHVCIDAVLVCIAARKARSAKLPTFVGGKLSTSSRGWQLFVKARLLCCEAAMQRCEESLLHSDAALQRCEARWLRSDAALQCFEEGCFRSDAALQRCEEGCFRSDAALQRCEEGCFRRDAALQRCEEVWFRRDAVLLSPGAERLRWRAGRNRCEAYRLRCGAGIVASGNDNSGGESDNSKIGTYAKLVDDRNDSAHPNGNIFWVFVNSCG
jgi:hypothetical protein